MAGITIKGDTSGEITLNVPATAGTNTITIPASSGTLAIQDGSGDLAVTNDITAGGNISTPTGTVTASSFSGDGSSLTGIAGGFSNMEVFTSPGTWTNPGSVTKVKVTVVGGGGSGANGGSNISGGGGGAGGTAIEVIPFPSATNVAVTAGGAAGTSSFGAYCSATGGAGGANSGNSGNGGSGSGGTINIDGGGGSSAMWATTGFGDYRISGDGGSSSLGGGKRGAAYMNGTGQVGSNVGAYGGGGGGGMPVISPSYAATSGAPGVVIVEY